MRSFIMSRYGQSCAGVYPRTAIASAHLEICTGDRRSIYLGVCIGTAVVWAGSLTRPDVCRFLDSARRLRRPGGCASLKVAEVGAIFMLAYPHTVEACIYSPGTACGGVVLGLTAAESDGFLGRLGKIVAKEVHLPLCLNGPSGREYTFCGSMRSRSGSCPEGAPRRDFCQ
jgi:hypothetical protein